MTVGRDGRFSTHEVGQLGDGVFDESWFAGAEEALL